MSAVLKQLMDDTYRRHLEFRRRDSVFHAFAGALVEAFRERNYRLVGFDTQLVGGADVMSVQFEQPDGDRIQIVLEPFQARASFLKAIGGVLELHCTLIHHVHDPEVALSAQSEQMRLGMSRALGSFSRRDDVNRGAALSPPGNIRFSIRGTEVTAAINLILNLKDYSLDSLDFDKNKVGETLDATVYGLEKCVAGVLSKHQTA